MDISKLKPGDNHYMAYVGPPARYDFMGASQFRLLCTLGLRAGHDLLDVGCGSLRGGRFFISYLDEGRYCGIEPNEWLIREAIEHQVGNDLLRIKKPRFDYNSDFATDVFGQPFDFIIAQSIFSHAGRDLIARALGNFRTSLKPAGIIAATFVEAARDYEGSGWVYPGCVTYLPSTVEGFAKEAGLSIVRIPWYHPSQTWYLMATDPNRLPGPAMMRFLYGAVLFDPAFGASCSAEPEPIRNPEPKPEPVQKPAPAPKPQPGFWELTRDYLKAVLPPKVKKALKKALRYQAPTGRRPGQI